jgi:plastocyanin
MTRSTPGDRLETVRRSGPLPLRFLVLAAIVVLSGFVTACGSTTKAGTSPSGGSAAPGGNSVTIKNFSFQPKTLTVRAGTTVTWTNDDSTPHTVQFSDRSIPTSPDLSAGGGQSQYSHTFTAAGTYPYICGIHTFMTGTIKVTP